MLSGGSRLNAVNACRCLTELSVITWCSRPLMPCQNLSGLRFALPVLIDFVVTCRKPGPPRRDWVRADCRLRIFFPIGRIAQRRWVKLPSRYGLIAAGLGARLRMKTVSTHKKTRHWPGFFLQSIRLTLNSLHVPAPVRAGAPAAARHPVALPHRCRIVLARASCVQERHQFCRASSA